MKNSLAISIVGSMSCCTLPPSVIVLWQLKFLIVGCLTWTAFSEITLVLNFLKIGSLIFSDIVHDNS